MTKQYITIQSVSKPQANPANALVSVVLPIYNAAAYLDQALDSAQNQTYGNIEIICVNDGSTDNSLEIMQRHAAEDSRIVVVDKKNEGYGAGMNRGIQEAHGEWIAILEPDDWLEPGMFKDMLEFGATFSTPIDIIKTPYWRILYPGTKQERRRNCPFKKTVAQSTRPFTIDKEPELLMHHPCIWTALYRKSFLDEFNIRFKPIPGAGWTDNPFMLETYCRARAIVYLDQAYYCYREETKDKTKSFHEKQPQVPFARWQEMQDLIEELNITDKGILQAHIKRGFTYSGGVLEFHTMEEPEIAAQVKAMYDRMDPDLVFANPDVQPNAKRLFAEVRGIPCPHISELKYKAHVAGLGLYAVRNIGVVETFRAATHYLAVKDDRGAHR